ncbi:MAG: AMIN domain-containing protein [Peptostreptococcaceae bacterium]|jgi:hypothetical protein|nr:AMIN domain-containing protein [Peptostreptococcaceae bacterium]
MKKILNLLIIFCIIINLSSCSYIDKFFNKKQKISNIKQKYIDGYGVGVYDNNLYYLARSDDASYISFYDLKYKTKSSLVDKKSDFLKNQAKLIDDKLYYFIKNKDKLYELYEFDIDNIEKKRLYYTSFNDISKTVIDPNYIYYLKSDLLEDEFNLYRFDRNTNEEQLQIKNIKKIYNCFDRKFLYSKEKEIGLFIYDIDDLSETQISEKNINSNSKIYYLSGSLIYRENSAIYKFNISDKTLVKLVDGTKYEFDIKDKEIYYSRKNSFNKMSINSDEEFRICDYPAMEFEFLEKSIVFITKNKGIYEYEDSKITQILNFKDFDGSNLWANEYFVSYYDNLIKDAKLLQIKEYKEKQIQSNIEEKQKQDVNKILTADYSTLKNNIEFSVSDFYNLGYLKENIEFSNLSTIRIGKRKNENRLVFEFNEEVGISEFSINIKENEVIVLLKNINTAIEDSLDLESYFGQIKSKKIKADEVEIIFEKEKNDSYRIFKLNNPNRIVIDKKTSLN